jgi:hypothetical protein
MNTKIGNYINRESQVEYEILEISEPVIEPLSSETKTLSAEKYVTKCGLEAEKISADFSEFELIESCSIVHKINI